MARLTVVFDEVDDEVAAGNDHVRVVVVLCHQLQCLLHHPMINQECPIRLWRTVSKHTEREETELLVC